MRKRKLELSSPLVSLRKMAKMPEAEPNESMTVDELAWIRRVDLEQVETDERKGGRLTIEALQDYVEIMGGTIEIHVTLPR